ncbi:stage II sporulation protein P, partial [Virgibacillus sp. DJP39]|uniref:stage II sporulation protein P n=1 Tax=Virgibacillus sp. DJP39 TaxID=3409790 RepID=UPI003BB6E29A
MQEIPGFNIVNAEIYIAGEGSDYSNLPQESPPPNFDELLEGQDTNQGNRAGTTKEDKGDTKGNPSVFIYHSHSWEGYLPLIDEDVKPSDSSSTNENENV